MNEYYQRKCKINFRVSDHELNIIHQRMIEAGQNNLSEYIRKKAKDGMIYNVKFDELNEILHELKKQGVNLNQIAYKANSTGYIDNDVLETVIKSQEKIWHEIHSLLIKISKTFNK